MNLITPSAADPAGSAQRILDGATGEWKTEFESTKTDFIDTIAQSKTESTGEILGAGIERANDDGTTSVMVAAVTKVTNAAGAKDEPRTWRLRVQVGKDGDLYKLAKIEVVP
jgi:Mce-associated membrane protein